MCLVLANVVGTVRKMMYTRRFRSSRINIYLLEKTYSQKEHVTIEKIIIVATYHIPGSCPHNLFPYVLPTL